MSYKMRDVGYCSDNCEEVLIAMEKIGHEIRRLDAIMEEYEMHGEVFCLDYLRYTAQFAKLRRKLLKIAKKC